MAVKKSLSEKPKRPTQKQQIDELRDQIAELMKAVGNGQSAVTPAEEVPSIKCQVPSANDQGPRTSDTPSGVTTFRAFILIVSLGFVCYAVNRLLPTAHSRSLPSHAAVVNFAHLLATDVCDELLAEVERAEEAGESISAEFVAKTIKERGEEARIAAWEPVLKSLNDLQDDEGAIPARQARKAIGEVRKGLEAVR